MRGAFRGYLNLTPVQGNEHLHGWAAFRIHHNREEGDRAVIRRAAAEGLRFRTGRGSCVIDEYRTSTAAYREIACLVAGRRAQTVAVGAAPPQLWPQMGRVLERAIAALQT